MSAANPGTDPVMDATVVDGGAPRPTIGPAAKAGILLGRYVVIEHAGSGAMGSVLRAYDPRLRREVAIKRVRADGRDPVARTRLLREAQAMARLSHPNAVAVYDVEPGEREVFFAMEYVPGGTLEQWLAARPRTVPEILDVMRQAGEGLAAAHAAELVHRDFKPANVMVGDDGRVKVTDFGLAKPTMSQDGVPTGGAPPLDDDKLTMAGTVMGTPRYMAPEQHTGAIADARADQYAWCVTAWEALAGKAPFRGRSVQELAKEKVAGAPTWPRARPIPRVVLDAIRRGLAVDPVDRWPSMTALLEALDRWRTRARRRRLALAGAGGLAVVAGLLGWRHVQEQQAIADCEAAGDDVATTWPGRREAMLAGLAKVDPEGAATTAERATPWLDAWAEQWRSARTEACLAAEVHRTMPAELQPRALGCLGESRTRIQAVLDAVAEGERSAAQGAIAAFAAPTELDACTDRSRLEHLPWPSVEQSSEVAELRTQLAHARGLRLAGRYELAQPQVEAVQQQARTLGFRPLLIETELDLGMLLELRAQYEPAREQLRAAFFDAASVGMDRVALESAARLVLTEGLRLAHADEGLEWAEHARVYVARLGDAARLSHANLLNNEAAVRRAKGQRTEAIALHEQALEIRESILGPDHPDVATSASNLALVVADTGDFAKARALHERALAIRERSLGPDHPNVASSLDNLGGVARAMGELDRAKELLGRAHGIWERSMGPDHPGVALSLSSLAVVELQRGDEAAATKAAERALQIREARLGPDHPDVAMTLDVLSSLRWRADRHDEAIAMNERAVEIRRRALGPAHTHVAASLLNLGEKHRAAKHWDRARESYQQSLAITEATLPPTHPQVLGPLIGLAELALDQREPEQTRTMRARLGKLDPTTLEPAARAKLEFVVARLDWDLGQPDPARAAAERAHATYAKIDPSGDETREVAAWLAETFGDDEP